ncbi:MAG: uroporphyrinogen decarboxylase [Flavobacteriales bacterium]|jgi:uroporphyrinogen decarboxylase
MKLENDLILRAARGEEVERTPVWLMRQAGRILPEYRAVRNGLKDFRELVETPEKAAEVTLQPVDLLGVDAAIIFSDILVVPDAMGLPYGMVPGVGPVFERTVKSAKDVQDLVIPDPELELKYVLDAIRLTKKELNNRVPLIGFAGAPWTILSYMIEGGGSKTFSKARKFLVTEPILAHQLLSKITESTIAYLNAQVSAGADMVQVFDSWAGVLSPSLYAEFGTPYIKMICDRVTGVPKTIFAKGAYFALQDLANLDCNTIGLDWQMDIKNARLVAPGKTLQGNLDPAVLYGDEASIVKETHAMLKKFGVQRHIANLGHGVYPDTEPEKVKVFIETIKEYKHTQL